MTMMEKTTKNRRMCSKHPKYTGKRAPRSGCGECLKIYLEKRKTKTRVILPPNKVHRDKTKYTRKKKYKGDENVS